MDDMYHPTADRSEFYSMSDLHKPPVLFTPSEDMEKVVSLEMSARGGLGGGSTNLFLFFLYSSPRATSTSTVTAPI